MSLILSIIVLVLLFGGGGAYYGRGAGWGASHYGGGGIGLIDAHLLYAAVAEGHVVWTRDARLRQIAARLGVECG